MNSLDLNIPLILACLAFAVICLLFTGALIQQNIKREKKERLEKIRAVEDDWQAMDIHKQSPGNAQKSMGPFMDFLANIGLKTKTGKSADNTGKRLKLLQAGLRGEKALPVFWGTKILLAAVLTSGYIIFAMAFLKTLNTTVLLYLFLLLALLGWMLPDIWLSIRTSKRKDRLYKGFPDALDLLVVCVESGMGLDQAFHRVAEEIGLTHLELGEELKLLNLELRAGKARPSALRNLASRTDIEDVKSLTTLLIQTDRFGTSIAKALRVYSDTFRTTRFQKAEEHAAKMGTKLIFPLALCIFPAFFIVGVGPAILGIFRIFLDK